jgi:hypothetical protein
LKYLTGVLAVEKLSIEDVLERLRVPAIAGNEGIK